MISLGTGFEPFSPYSVRVSSLLGLDPASLGLVWGYCQDRSLTAPSPTASRDSPWPPGTLVKPN